MNALKFVVVLISLTGIVGAVEIIADDEDWGNHVIMSTWNVRGYPEKNQGNRDWFSEQLDEMSADIICVQEIANQKRVDKFLEDEDYYSSEAFLNSSDGMDNAVFTAPWIQLDDMPDPTGFQHPAQAAYVSYLGFDAVVVTVHLSWTDTAMREKEKALLKGIVTQMLNKDPDVIIAGDFNTKEKGIQELAQSIGMEVMVPADQDGVGTTHAGNRYDHFLVSPDLANEEAVRCCIVTFAGSDLKRAKKVSDHLPVLALFNADAQYRDRP